MANAGKWITQWEDKTVVQFISGMWRQMIKSDSFIRIGSFGQFISKNHLSDSAIDLRHGVVTVILTNSFLNCINMGLFFFVIRLSL